MSTQYGLTTQGFVVKPQQVIISEITSVLQETIGDNINTGPQSVFGQIIGIFSEREALLWQLLEAIYASQYPGGAEGTSVDNILALNNLKRLEASPSVVDLVLTGTPGTVIPKGSLAQTASEPPIQFGTDEQAIIAAAVNCVQTLFFSSLPTLGAFKLSIVDPDGNTLTTGNIYWMAPVAAGTSVLQCQEAPASGQYKITVGGLTTGFIQWNASATAVQTALRLLSGYGSVTVAGINISAGFTITWTGVADDVGRLGAVVSSTLDTVASFGNAIQDLISTLQDVLAVDPFPYADVVVSGAFNTGIVLTFAGTSGSKPQNLVSVSTNSLFNGSVAVNINPVMTNIGSPAEVSVGATCLEDGPNFAIAGAVNVIGTPVSGWTGVTNPLDVESGRNDENDTEALVRRDTQLAAQANGPIQAIVQKVKQIPGLKNVVGLQNLNMATSQLLMFSSVPTVGTYMIQFGGPASTWITSSLAHNATAEDIQTAINLLFNLSDVTVEGDTIQGFRITFGPTSGLGTQPLVIIYPSGLDADITPVQGLPGKSFEIIVNYPSLPLINDALELKIAQAIYDSKPAGMLSYGSPVLSTTGNVAAASDQLTSLASVEGLAVGMMIIGPGIPIDTFINSILGSTVTMSNEATITDTVNVIFKTAIPITDEDDNIFYIQFSKPQLVPIYISIAMTVSRKLFPADGVQQIQNDMVAIGDNLGPGDPVTLFGSDGLVGAFNSVPGIVNYTLTAGVASTPTESDNIILGSYQQAQIESFNIICTVTFV